MVDKPGIHPVGKTEFRVATSHDKITLDIGTELLTRFFLTPDLALQLADELRRAVAILKPPMSETAG